MLTAAELAASLRISARQVQRLTAADMRSAEHLILERADDADGGVLIRVSQEQRPQIVEHVPVLVKVDTSIVLTND